MKRIVIILSFVIVTLPCCSKSVSGLIIDSSDDLSVGACLIEIHGLSHHRIDSLYSDSKGYFSYPIDSIEGKLIIFSISKVGYLKKEYCLQKTEVNGQLKIRLRRISSSAIAMPKMDSALIGLRLKRVCKSLKLTEGDFRVIHEPSLIARGICFKLPDETFVNLYIERIADLRNTKKVLNQKIIGIANADSNCDELNYYGEGMPWIGMIGLNCD